MGWQNAHQREGDGSHDHKRCEIVLKPAHHKPVNEDHHHTKGQAQIAEYFQGNMPFAIPFDSRRRLEKGLFQIEYLNCSRFAAIIGRIQLGQLFVHL